MTEKTAEQTAIRMALLKNGYVRPTSGTTATEATKRGYGLWRGEVIHPADPRMDAIVSSGHAITDTKGLGLRYVPVRGSKAVPHFRVHDPEKFSVALDRTFPAIHDAVVRLVTEDIRTGGYDALVRWCAGTVLPPRFEVANVVREMPCREVGVSYRPDVATLHPEGARIELEVVNTHAPEERRLEAAWAAGHLVLSLRIRDIVEDIVFSEKRGVVPEDSMLREMLHRRRFTLCGQAEVPETVKVLWRDLNLAQHAASLRADIRAHHKRYTYARVDPILSVTVWGSAMSTLDDPVQRAAADEVYDLVSGRRGTHESCTAYAARLKMALTRALRWDDCREMLRSAEEFLGNFPDAPAGKPYDRNVAALRRIVKAVNTLDARNRSMAHGWADDIAASER